MAGGPGGARGPRPLTRRPVGSGYNPASVKRHPLLTLTLVVDLMFAGGVAFTILALHGAFGDSPFFSPPLVLAGLAIVADSIAWHGVRWALFLRGGGAFVLGVILFDAVREDPETMAVVIFVQQLVTAPALLVFAWTKR